MDPSEPQVDLGLEAGGVDDNGSSAANATMPAKIVRAVARHGPRTWMGGLMGVTY